MRRALSLRLQELLKFYGREVVAPLIDAATAGGTTNPQIMRLLGIRRKSVALLDPGPLAFWRANGNLVKREYEQWATWLRTTPLSAPPILSSAGASSEVAHLFNEILYGVGLNDESLWTAITGDAHNRRALCEVFLEDVGHSVCPYCDIDTVRGAYYFDHFVPRSLSPYLAVAPENLYLACGTCNSPQLGKGNRITFPAARPDTNDSGSRLFFSFCAGAIEVEAPRAPAEANVFSTLQLRRRYAGAVVYRDVMTKAQRVYESALRTATPFSLSDLLTYHQRDYMPDPLYFATRAALADTYWGDVE